MEWVVCTTDMHEATHAIIKSTISDGIENLFLTRQDDKLFIMMLSMKGYNYTRY